MTGGFERVSEILDHDTVNVIEDFGLALGSGIDRDGNTTPAMFFTLTIAVGCTHDGQHDHDHEERRLVLTGEADIALFVGTIGTALAYATAERFFDAFRQVPPDVVDR